MKKLHRKLMLRRQRLQRQKLATKVQSPATANTATIA